MAYESSNETAFRPPMATVSVSTVTSHDDVLFSYLQKVVTSTFRPLVHPVALVGRHESRADGVEKFRVSVVGWNSLDKTEMFFVPPQEGANRNSALMAAIRVVEKKAHERMADLEGTLAKPA
ncbi:hypothetical protein G6011_04268 [Alternaria panax]|uniref:Uncharacterized protein n=1 Tax=Alternaria panax TaxID=48097 RepID=A0AAD4IGX7_9PLEO|nr:hypothetical protein G6011_04268 [Alternaria panax]